MGRKKNTNNLPTSKPKASETKENKELIKLFEQLSTLDLENIPDGEFQQLYTSVMTRMKELAREDFYVFVLLCAPLVIPEGFKNGPHIKLIADRLTKVERSVGTPQAMRQMIFLPPRHMKSVLVNKLFVPWCFGRHPSWKILVIGHGAQFAETEFGRPTRDFMSEPLFQEIFPEVTLKKDSRAAGRWETEQKGKYEALGANAGIAGKGGNLVIADDVLNEQTAVSKIERNNINKWYAMGLRSRLQPNSAEVIVNTRWHEEDLSGFLLKKDKDSVRPWDVISIPALLDEDAAEMLGLEVGGSSFPQLWSKDYFEDMRDTDTLTDHQWNALYMQRPTSEEGNIIKTDDIKYWEDEESPPLSYVLMSLDTAFSEKEHADYSAMTIWGIFPRKFTTSKGVEGYTNHIILLSAKRGRWSFPELKRQVEAKYDQYQPDGMIIEKKASGQSLIQELRQTGFPVIEYTPDRGKTERLHSASVFFSSGRVWFPKNRQWAQDVIDELLSFPHAPHDDLTDTTSQAILWLRDSFNASTDERDSLHEEDEDSYKPKRTTYWDSVS